MGSLKMVCPFCNQFRDVKEVKQLDDLHILILFPCGDKDFPHHKIDHDPVESVYKKTQK